MIYVLDRNEFIAGVLVPNLPDAPTYYDDEFTERLDGSCDLTFSVPVIDGTNFYVSDYLISGALCIYTTRYGKQFLMKIIEAEELHENGVIVKNIVAENSAISEISRAVVRPYNYVYDSEKKEGKYLEFSWNVYSLFQYILNSANWTINKFEYSKTASINYTIDGYDNAYKHLQDLAEKIGVELEFVTVMEGSRTLGRYLNVYSQRGNNTCMTFTYGIDIVDVTRKIDSKDTVSGILALGKAMEDGKRLTIETATDPIDPLFEDDFYIDGDIVYSNSARTSSKTINNYVGIFEDTEVTDPDYLLALAQQQLEQRLYPKIEYSMTVLTLREYTGEDTYKPVRLGDEILVIDTSLRPILRTKTRVAEMITSNTDLSKESITLGDVSEILQDPTRVVKDIKSYIYNKGGTFENKASVEYVETHIDDTNPHILGNVTNQNVSTTEPTSPSTNDIWIDIS